MPTGLASVRSIGFSRVTVRFFFFLGREMRSPPPLCFCFCHRGVVDAGAVAGGEDFAAGGGVLAPRVPREAFAGVPVVFLFTLRVRQAGERLGAQVEGEEVADRAFRAVDRISVDGGPVPGAVGGVEIEVTQAVELGEAIIGEQLSDAGAALLAELQAAGTFEGRENMGDPGTLRKQGATRCRKPRPLGWS